MSVEDSIEGSCLYQLVYFRYSFKSSDPFIIWAGAKNMSSVELTIFDNAAHCRNVMALAPGLRYDGEFGGPQGLSSSSSSSDGSSTVIELVSI